MKKISLSMRGVAQAGLLSVFLCGTLPATAADTLPSLHAAAERTSVSGLSSGGFMAVQYSVAFSSSLKGVGVVAGGPYNCAFLTLGGISACMGGAPSGEASWLSAQGFAALGQIDPSQGIAKLKVYVFSGTKDETVVPTAAKATRDFYAAAGVPPGNLSFVSTMPAGHAFIAPDFGHSCGATEPPYITHCTVKKARYDQPQAIFKQIYGPLKPAAKVLSRTVRPFDQREFGGAETGLDGVGFYYLPQSCAEDSSQCSVHVVFHGCEQGAGAVGSDVYARVGYNRWADANQIIVLYPQIVPTSPAPFNPKGCWDWWGYSSLGFQVRSGPQMRAVKAMVDRLTNKS